MKNTMSKSQKKKSFKISQDSNNILIEKNEIANTAQQNETAEKEFCLGSSEDFPELKTSSGSNQSMLYLRSNNSGLHSNRSWLSVVSKGSKKNLREEFPSLSKSEYSKRNRDLRSIKEDVTLQFITRNENSVLEKASSETEPQSQAISKKKKFCSSKKVFTQPQRNPYKKKRSDPIDFNILDVLAVFKPLDNPKKPRHFKSKLQRHGNNEQLSGNYLDSSNPKRSRGKHREIKKKKLSKLKLTIVKERVIKQKMKEEPLTACQTENSCFNFIEKIDFKAEIQAYLEKLNKKKRQNLERMSNQSIENSSLQKIAEPNLKNKDTKNGKKEENLESVLCDLKNKKAHMIPAGSEMKFSSKFREYCDNLLTPALNSAVSELIGELVKLQDKLFARDPIRAKSKKRHVSGIREVKKYLTLKKVKLIIVAPNLEKLQMEGSIYDLVNELKSMADSQSVPYGFALDRYGLGRCTKKNVPVSAFAVLNYEGIEGLFEKTLHHLSEAKEKFLELKETNIKKVEGDTGKEDINAKVISSLISVFQESLQVSLENSRLE